METVLALPQELRSRRIGRRTVRHLHRDEMAKYEEIIKGRVPMLSSLPLAQGGRPLRTVRFDGLSSLRAQ
jgi:hypothetical protein